MKTIKTCIAGLLLLPAIASAGMDDDPLLTMVKIDQLETRVTSGSNPLVLEADAWIGKDLDKLWLKTDVERVGGHIEEAELQALYSRAIAPFWDLQIGWRRDFKPNPDRDWLALGFKGLAPYWYEVDAAAFVGTNGQLGLRLQGEYEWMFTQRWVLSPELEVNLHSKDDESVGTGAGLTDLQLGLRLRYEIRREFAPYIGVNWNRKFGETANFARHDGEKVDDVQLVAGIRAWF